ncbi:LapB repeat-containing protein [Listeria sp. FSL L7-1426]|uniref:LapB repeat-containing protein n=1 Tax=Listeria cossartiae TaxID=2838249 RepID=UPI001628E602|nr:LapB repeat-containing protein [Listeria cossartiae]MBC1571030.1 LapB repeat-containing protein [Listeria cossartiae subsp. cossartiae]
MKKAGIKIGLCILLIAPLTIPNFTSTFAEENIETNESQDIVNIPDPVLKSYLNGLLGQAATSDITEAQMDKIKLVDINVSTLTDLTGLEFAHNLTSLSLFNTSVTDFSLIANMTSLNKLSISGTNLTDDSLPDLNGLINLNTMDLSNTNINDNSLDKINKLPQLTTLTLGYVYALTDIMPLQSLPNLTSLDIQFCGVHDFRGIENFPKLTSLSAHGQNVGRTSLINSTIKSSVLSYDETKQTIFVPFALMKERSINFDGVVIPFTTSNSGSSTFFSLNNEQIASTRLTIDDTGITVSGITKEYFDSIEQMKYNARYNNPAGAYATPPNLTRYTLTGGTYTQYFAVEHTLNIASDSSMSYVEQSTITEEKFLEDIHAETDDDAPVTSDFTDVVDLNTPGVYTVTLNAENSAGLKAAPQQVTVTILEIPVITAMQSITYLKESAVTEEQFLLDILAETSDDSEITSDFYSVVDLNKVGTYAVTLDAVSESGIEADPVTISVEVAEEDEPVKPTPTPDPDEQNETGDDGDSVSANTPGKNVSDPVNKALPRTGDSNQATTVLIGILLAGIATIFFRKRKHS